MAYMPEKDKTFRLQATTPYFQAGRIFAPEGKTWVEEFIAEVCSYNPKPGGGNSAPHDDYTDTLSQAILWMRDNFMIDNDGYSNRMYNGDDDDYYWTERRRTYWSTMTE